MYFNYVLCKTQHKGGILYSENEANLAIPGEISKKEARSASQICGR